MKYVSDHNYFIFCSNDHFAKLVLTVSWCGFSAKLTLVREFPIVTFMYKWWNNVLFTNPHSGGRMGNFFHQVRLTNNTEVQFTAALCRKLIFFIHYTHAFFVPFCIFTWNPLPFLSLEKILLMELPGWPSRGGWTW